MISEDKDHIEGILMAKDLLPFMRSDAEAFSMDKVLRQAVVVPESKRVDRMLKEFRSQRYHMAIVIDEFGGVSGLVTIEDILEPCAHWLPLKTSTKRSAPTLAMKRLTLSVVW